MYCTVQFVHLNFNLIQTNGNRKKYEQFCDAQQIKIIMQCFLVCTLSLSPTNHFPPTLLRMENDCVRNNDNTYSALCTHFFPFSSPKNSIQTMTGQAEKKSSIVRVKSQSYEIPCKKREKKKTHMRIRNDLHGTL